MKNILEYTDFLNETKRKTIDRGSSAYLTIKYIGRNGGSRTERDFGGYFNYVILKQQTILSYFSIQCDNSQKYLQPGNKAKLEAYSNRNERDDFQKQRSKNNPLKEINIPLNTNYEIYPPDKLRKSGELLKSTGGFYSIRQEGDSVYITIYGVSYPADLSLSDKLQYNKNISRDEQMECIKGLMIQEIYRKKKNWTVSHTHKYIKLLLPTYNGKNGELDQIFKYIQKYTDISIEEIIKEFRLDKIYPDLSQYL